ncbi:MAG: hypothetical protein KF764_22850 [Labilithrix sp.]|nr:hypothetical protein [Labilithrix sp.]MBX3223796.1 hypothetical protein [Labilithrix sp.]
MIRASSSPFVAGPLSLFALLLLTPLGACTGGVDRTSSELVAAEDGGAPEEEGGRLCEGRPVGEWFSGGDCNSCVCDADGQMSCTTKECLSCPTEPLDCSAADLDAEATYRCTLSYRTWIEANCPDAAVTPPDGGT